MTPPHTPETAPPDGCTCDKNDPSTIPCYVCESRGLADGSIGCVTYEDMKRLWKEILDHEF